VGRELSKLHSRNRAEANSMPSRRTYNSFDIMNKQLFFSPLYLCVNKLSDYKYATMLAQCQQVVSGRPSRLLLLPSGLVIILF